MSENKIECPNCGHLFDVEAVLAHQAEHRIRQEMENSYAGRFKELESEKEGIRKDKEELVEKKAKLNEMFQERLAKELEVKKKELAIETEKDLKEEYQLRMTQMEEEIEKRKVENRALKEQELELKKREFDLKERSDELELTLQKKLLDGQREIEEKARNKEREAMSMREKEFQKQLEDQKKLIEEMKRKAEQGSMQLQGEVQELALEELLSVTYPFDLIEEVPKGVRGADCVQTVRNKRQQTCGSIVYESKRTKHFANDWIDKLKQDQIQCKADIAVIVTATYPADMDRFGERNGVWICGFHEVKSLSFVLREMLIKTHSVKSSEVNKGDKMELLYSYLTSNEFVQNIERIVENYDGMTHQLNSEKKAMNKIWASREKQIWVVQENLSALFGSIKGIAGNSIGTISALELPDTDEND